MLNVTYKPVVFAHWKRQDGTYNVRIRITFKRRCRYLLTTESVVPSQMTRTLKLKDPNVIDRLEQFIRTLREKVAHLNYFELDSMDVDDIIAYLRRAGTEESFFLDFPQYCRGKIAKMGRGAKNYTSALNSFCDFYEKPSFDISEITSSVMVRYERWLREKHGQDARAISLYTNSISYLHSLAREEYNNEEVGRVLVRNPFSQYKCPKQPRGEHRNVPPALLNVMLMTRKKITGRERLAVDSFLLSFALMGCNIPDLYECVLIGDTIHYNRRKTRDRRADGAEMQIRVEPQIRPLLREYLSVDGKSLSFASRYATWENYSRAVGIGLHEFEKRMGLKPLTFYMCRHTWATVARSRVCGINKSDVNDCLCHVDSGMRVTDIYAEKDWAVLWDANRKVQNLFAWELLID